MADDARAKERQTLSAARMDRRGPRAAILADGRRLHLHHGPIDLVIEGFGAPAEIVAAYRQARDAFGDVLATLVGELSLLRAPLGAAYPGAQGPVARRMIEACWPYRSRFITPMAAVAGAVADHVLAHMLADRALDRAYVNNGGDIAVHLAPGAKLRCGMIADLMAPAIDGAIAIEHAMPVRGVATSGWRAKGRGGRSFSFGIADAVTVLAADAAAADAAATIVANAVDLPDHPAIGRVAASEIDPDSDLGARKVTIEVPPLGSHEIHAALADGAALAEELVGAGLIFGAVLVLQRRFARVGGVPPRLAAA